MRPGQKIIVREKESGVVTRAEGPDTILWRRDRDQQLCIDRTSDARVLAEPSEEGQGVDPESAEVEPDVEDDETSTDEGEETGSDDDGEVTSDDETEDDDRE